MSKNVHCGQESRFSEDRLLEALSYEVYQHLYVKHLYYINHKHENKYHDRNH